MATLNGAGLCALMLAIVGLLDMGVGGNPNGLREVLSLWSALWWPWVGYTCAALITTQIARYFNDHPGVDGPDIRALAGILWPLTVLVCLAVLVGRAVRAAYRPVNQRVNGILLRLAVMVGSRVDGFVFRVTARLEHKDEYGELWSHRIPDSDERLYRVKVQDSTGIYYIRVAPSTETAQEGVARSYALMPSQLTTAVRF